MSSLITNLKDVPAHLWLLIVFLACLASYTYRPDPVVYDLVKTVLGGYLTASVISPRPQTPSPSTL